VNDRLTADYTADTDDVFAGSTGRPQWKKTVLAERLKPAAARGGIGPVGWHTFRRTSSTLLPSLGTAPVVQKKRLRRADIRTTLDIYTQAISDEKREATSKVAHTFLQGE
jgi:integrase